MGVERHAAAHHQPAPPSAPHQEVNTFALFHPAAAMQQQLLSTPPHPSPPPPHPPPPPDLQAIQFKLWDANGDGVVSPDEFAKAMAAQPLSLFPPPPAWSPPPPPLASP